MKLYLAPLQGMTNAFYRNSYAKIFQNIDKYYAPFIPTTSHKFNFSVLKDIFPENNSKNITLVPQLLSNNGDDFHNYANIIHSLNYSEINWNIGCPFPTVTSKKRGSGILPYPELIQNFLEAIFKNNPKYKMSIKMRLGLNDQEEGIKVINILNNYPIYELTIHGRIGTQVYKGNVDLIAFEKLISLSKHDIVYNGDILSIEDFNKIKERFPNINKFMLGRGALRYPFLPSKIKGFEIDKNEEIKKLYEFHNLIYEYCKNTLSGEKHLYDKMKEFWTYMSYSFNLDEKAIKTIKKCQNTTTYLNIIDTIFKYN